MAQAIFNVSAYTDGACSGNPGPAGIGAVFIYGKQRAEISRAIGHATNNIAEIQAVINAIRAVHRPELTNLTIFTDSKLVHGFLMKNWKAKANQSLVAEMRKLAKKCLTFKAIWVKAHNGDPNNERADQLAKRAIS